MTTLTVYSDASDGRIESSSTVYATARTGANFVISDSVSANSIGQTFETPTYYVREMFLNFDTSSIPDTDTIDSVVLSMYGFQDLSDTDFTMEAYLKDWGASLDTGDWVAGADLGAQTLLATLAVTVVPTNAYTAFTSESGFVNYVNKTGLTRLMLSSSRTRAGTTPTGFEAVSWNMSESANKPKLVVNHSTPVSTMSVGLTIGT
jgi:hypothetical protein